VPFEGGDRVVSSHAFAVVKYRINCLPPVSTSMLILLAQASSAFFEQFLYDRRRRSTTSPAAILLPERLEYFYL